MEKLQSWCSGCRSLACCFLSIVLSLESLAAYSSGSGPSFGSLSWLAFLPSTKDIVLDCLGDITRHISPETRVMRCSRTLSHLRPGFFLWKLSPKGPLHKQLSQEPLTQAPPQGKHIVATFINSVTSLPPRTYKPQSFLRCYS